VRAAAAFHEDRRIRLGRLTFQDLLMGAARLLRESPSARRALAERYRYLLVDEFQDTDPVQAEVVFLLAGEDAGETDWTRVRMRPGALFVVGDPKQSIYRFRRADITVYNRVRSLFETDPRGEVLELVANFRSTPPFERFVEDVFRDTACGFPSDEATPHQAKFAPLKTQQPDTPKSGIYTYTVPGRNQGTVESEDARRLAAWIAARVRDPQDPRSAGDFLVLTWRKRPLAGIAEALERWGIPVQLTGGGVAIEHELAELVALLRSLADPDDPVRAVAVLVGLFFGLDYDALYRHRRGGGRFQFVRPPEGDGPVDRALATMHRWYRRSLEVPGDILVAEIVDQAGLLPLAACGTNGGTRAGSLLFALEVLRQAARSGAASARDMAEALEEAVADAEVEAPLDPGRADAVRVMNLHKAKGLQARVVVLAWPAGHWDHEVTAHVRRDPDGGGEAFFCVREGQGRDARTVAQPADWDSHADAEKAFETAEQDRLRYVAVTRAREELLVSRCSAMESGGKSPWGALCEALESHATHLELDDAEPPAREVLDASDSQIVARIRETEASRNRLRAPSHYAAAVTGLVKGERAPGDTGRPASSDGDRSEPGGIPWGNAVHRALEAAAAGMEGESLRMLCRNVLVEEGLTDEAGKALHLAELLTLIGEVRRSDLWKRVEAAQQVLVEIPISFRATRADVAARVEAEDDGDDAPLVLDGVIDLAFKEDDGWVLVDWKTDRSPTEETVHRYERQLEVYQACWEALSGEPVQDRKLFFVRDRIMR
jgi:ATP-dependent helicase/nuclease subunit A